MRNKLLTLAIVVAAMIGCPFLGGVVVKYPDTGAALLAGLAAAFFFGAIMCRDQVEGRFLLKLFVAAVILRWTFSLGVYLFNWTNFFGPDAETYDTYGGLLALGWRGVATGAVEALSRFTNINTSGWGMYYFVGSVYFFFGRNPLAVQLINGTFGAASCVLVYKITYMVYPVRRAARFAAVITAISPSMILWSAQELKDAPIVLCLCACALCSLKLAKKPGLGNILLLLLNLFFIFSLRHYIFYILFVAIVGMLLLGSTKMSPARIMQSAVLVIILGLAFSYFGAGGVIQQSFDLNKIQAGRQWSASVANSGYGGEVDITDPQAALSYLPIGLLYMLFAPFPWMITNIRQLITLPELLAWWVLAPMLGKGFWEALTKHFRESFAIVLFTLGLTLVYALYQTNVGTAYRHRAQLYVFFFVFISIGLDVRRAAKEARKPGKEPGFKLRALPPGVVVPRGAAPQVPPRLPAPFGLPGGSSVRR